MPHIVKNLMGWTTYEDDGTRMEVEYRGTDDFTGKKLYRCRVYPKNGEPFTVFAEGPGESIVEARKELKSGEHKWGYR